MFYENLLELCKSRNTNVTNLLLNLKLSTSKGTAWKSGSVPTGDILLKIANYFNVTTDYLLTGKEAEQPTPTTITKEDQEILTMYNALSERKKGEIYGTLKTLSSLHDDNITKRELEFTNDLANLAKEDVNVFSVHKNQV